MPFFISKSRKISVLKDSFCDHFSKYKPLYLLFLVVLLAGFVVGLISGGQKASLNDISYLPDRIWFGFLSNNITIMQLFFSRVLSLFGLMILGWILCFNKWLSLLNVLIVVYNAFILGATCSMLVGLFRFVGVLNVLLAYLPLHLLSLGCFVCFCVVSVKYAFETCNFGYNVLSKNYFDVIKQSLLVLVCLHFLSCVVEILILPWLSASILVS